MNIEQILEALYLLQHICNKHDNCKGCFIYLPDKNEDCTHTIFEKTPYHWDVEGKRIFLGLVTDKEFVKPKNLSEGHSKVKEALYFLQGMCKSNKLCEGCFFSKLDRGFCTQEIFRYAPCCWDLEGLLKNYQGSEE